MSVERAILVVAGIHAFYACVCVCMCVWVSVCVSVCLCLCVCVYTRMLSECLVLTFFPLTPDAYADRKSVV